MAMNSEEDSLRFLEVFNSAFNKIARPGPGELLCYRVLLVSLIAIYVD